MNEKLKDSQTDFLFSAMMTLETLDDFYSFFEDLCTASEIKSMAQRIQVASLLDEGKTYSEIFEITGVSTATISRVNRSLEYGADGYQTALKRLKNKN